MTKEQTINEKEARANIHEALTADGVTITKTAVDQVLDKAADLSIAALAQGFGVKVQGLGTLEVRAHVARTRVVPVDNGDGTWSSKVVDSPAGNHVKFNISDSLLTVMNSEATEFTFN